MNTSKKKKCMFTSFWVILLIFYFFITVAWADSQSYQIITSVPSSANNYTGQTIELDLMYSASYGYSQLNGLGLSIHYDSDFFSDVAISYSLNHTTGSPYFSDESTSHSDGDPDTDKTVTIGWYDQSTNWPGQVLPVKLCTISLTTSTDLLENDQSRIHITSTSTHLNYAFQADPITITIGFPDDAPIVANPVDNITVDEDAPEQTIDLGSVFSDSDNDDSQISISIQANSNPELVSATISNQTLNLEFLADQFGSAELVIQGLSNGKTASDTFMITVDAVDDPPVVKNPISISVNEDDSNQLVDLTHVFFDVDSSIVTSIQSNSNPSLISLSLNENILNIEFLADQFGTSDISISAQGDSQIISETFTITVTPENDPPTISHIADQQVFDESTQIAFTISDIESSADNLTVTIESSSSVILPIPENVYISDSGTNRILSLTPVESAYGSSMITLVVNDGTDTASTSFSLTNVQPTYTIVTLSNGNGSITPSGNITVQKGENLTLSIEPESGHQIDDILVNEASIGALTQYTFSVTQNYTIVASFVPDPPIADFYAQPVSGDAPLRVSFVNTSQNDISAVQWIFGDNAKSSAMSPEHTYGMPGEYTVCLQVTGPGGSDMVTKTAYIQVNESCDLEVQFSADQRNVGIDTNIQLTSIISDTSATLEWDFGDGETSQELNPVHAYASPGFYSIRLTVTGSTENCSETILKNEYIQVIGRQITGQVRTVAGGAANCLISLWDSEYQMLAFAMTEPNGDYTLDRLPAISGLTLSVIPSSDLRDRYMKQYYPNATIWADAAEISTIYADAVCDIDFIEPPNNCICGQVTDGQVTDGNQGIFEVEIYSQSLDLIRTTLSNDQGYYTFTELPSATDYVVSANLETINQEYFYTLPQGLTPGESIPETSATQYSRAMPVEPVDPCLSNINIIIQNGQISGTVTSESTPLSNVWVNAWSSGLQWSNGSFTDDYGQYTITGLISVSDTDALSLGYIVEIQSIGFPYQVFNNQTEIDQATTVETGRQDIDFKLLFSRQVTGTVRNIDGSTMSNVLVKFSSDATNTQETTYTNENGRYTSTHLPLATDYIAYAYANNYPRQYYSNAATIDEAQQIDLFDNIPDIDFVMDKGSYIKGQVFFENGTPVGEGIWVTVWSESKQSGGDIPTDTTGKYEITGLDPDANDYIVAIWNANYLDVFYATSGMEFDYASATPIAPSDESRNLTLTTGYCIQGLINYLQEPIADIDIWADGPATASTISTDTPDVNYTVCGLAPGNYEVSISSDLYLDDTYDTSVAITNNNRTGIDFELETPTRKLSGIINNVQTDEIITLTAWSQLKDCMETIYITGNGSAMPFTFTNLHPASDYRLEIRPELHNNQMYNNKTTWANADRIDLQTLDVTDIEITLTQSEGQISGYVQFPDPLIQNDSVLITAYSIYLNQQKSTIVSPSGGTNVAYTLTGLGQSTDFEVYLTSDIYEQKYFASLVDTSDAQPDDAIDFTLTPGGSISGQVMDFNSNAMSGLDVMVWSDQLSMGGTAETDSNGNYQVNGLNAASDYVISVQDSTTTFYYHSDGTVVQESKKGSVALSAGESITPINLQLIQGDSIQGVIKNSAGELLANIYVSARSESLDAGGSCFSNAQGEYRIDNLLSSQDYTIEAIPGNDLNYISQIKSNIDSSDAQINFILQTGYILSGQVNKWDQTPVANVSLKISSIAQDIFQTETTDTQGTYELQGLPESTDYIVEATPPNDSNLSLYEEKDFVIDEDTSLQITLSSALTISGTVSVIVDSVSQRYTQNARINVYSEDGFDQWTDSDSQGNFIFYHLPDATNYEISVYADGYADQTVYQVAAGDVISVTLSESKQVMGDVKNSRGQAISNARVEIYSAMQNLTKSTTTLTDGSFAITGLPVYYNAILIDDYRLTITANAYPEVIKNNISLDTSISIVLEADESLFISGTVTDIDGNPIPENNTVMVRLYKKVSDDIELKTKKAVDENGQFAFTGLNANKQYKLKFTQFDNDTKEMKEWAGENSTGVKRKDAAIFNPGNIIQFRFSKTWD